MPRWGCGHPRLKRHRRQLQGPPEMTTDDEVGNQILGIFIKHRVLENGVLRRNHFMAVRDADFQRGLKKAVEHGWIKIHAHDRYKYELTGTGLAAGSQSQF